MPPWLEAFLNQSSQQNKGPYAQTATATATPPAPVTPPVQGGDMLDVFTKALASHLATQDAMAPQRQQFAQDFTFGRHLGTGGGVVSPSNPTGDAADPWAAGGLFNGNATNVAATAERARPTGTNYGPAGPGVQSSQTLAPLTDAGMRKDEVAYAPRIPDPNYKFGLPVPPPHQKPFRAPGTF